MQMLNIAGIQVIASHCPHIPLLSGFVRKRGAGLLPLPLLSVPCRVWAAVLEGEAAASLFLPPGPFLGGRHAGFLSGLGGDGGPFGHFLQPLPGGEAVSLLASPFTGGDDHPSLPGHPPSAEGGHALLFLGREGAASPQVPSEDDGAVGGIDPLSSGAGGMGGLEEQFIQGNPHSSAMVFPLFYGIGRGGSVGEARLPGGLRPSCLGRQKNCPGHRGCARAVPWLPGVAGQVAVKLLLLAAALLAGAGLAAIELGSLFLADEAGQIAAILGLGLVGGAAIVIGDALEDFGFHGLAGLHIPERRFHVGNLLLKGHACLSPGRRK